MANSKQLEEVNFIRPIAIILLVFVHSMAPYTGAWDSIDGISDITTYRWLGKSVIIFNIEALAFVSGYLLSFIINVKGRKYTFMSLTKQKIKRLIIPSLFFSFFYSLFFYENDFFTFNYWYKLLCGCGHMWYLPMLFWCILISFLLFKINIIDERIKLVLLFFFSLFDFIPLPLRLPRTIHFLFFFYAGTYFFLKKDYIRQYATKRNIIVCLILYLLSFVIFSQCSDVLRDMSYNHSYIYKILNLSISNLCKLIYATIGMFLFYITSLYVVDHYSLPKYFINLNPICYGIYFLQQFILIYLYYYTSFPSLTGEIFMPWISFTITLFLSIVLSKFLIRTKLGKFLIG